MSKKTWILLLNILLFTLTGLAQKRDSLEAMEYLLPIPKGYPAGVAISYDGNFLVLATRTKDSSYLFEYKRKDFVWVLSQEIGRWTYSIFSPFYSADNNTVYFAVDSGSGSRIFFINRLDKGWSDAKKVFINDSLAASVFAPCVDPMGRWLFYSAKADKEECGHINYIGWRGGWHSKPQKMIPPINLGCDIYPRLQYDGQGMFFASRRGRDKSLDIYYTRKITEEIFLIPERLGFSHTRQDEFSPTYDPVTSDMVFIRNVHGHNKLMSFHLPDRFAPSPVVILSGKVINRLTGKPIKATVEVLNPVTNTPYNHFVTYTGHYQLFLYPDRDYIIKFSGEGLSSHFINWKAHKLDSVEHQNIDVELFDKVRLTLNIYDQQVYDRVDADFSVYDSLTGKQLSDIKYRRLEAGKYEFTLPIGRFYSVKIKNPNYAQASFGLDLRGTIIYRDYEKDVDIKPLLQKVVLKVVDAFDQRGVVTEVEVVSKTTGAKYKVKVKTDENGNAVLFLRKGDVYDISITPKGYTFFSQELDLVSDTVPQEVVAKVEPLKKNLQMQFHNITFELNSADLKEESYPILNQLVEFMKKNPNIKVEISAHTDDLGSEQYNLKLSLRRANSVVEYLKEHGIPEDRMIAIGYGESRPLVPNDSDEHRAMNRRVEFKILEIK